MYQQEHPVPPFLFLLIATFPVFFEFALLCRATGRLTDGDSAQSEESAAKSEALARKQKKGQKLASAGRGARGSNVHDTKRAMQDDEYSQAGAE